MSDIWQKILFRILSKAEVGRLEISLSDDTEIVFGDPSDFENRIKMEVIDDSCFRDILLRGDIGLGESYTAGKWDADDLVGIISWFIANKNYIFPEEVGYFTRLLQCTFLLPSKLIHLLRRNSRSQSKKNIHDHYDLGNKFYELFLDGGMTYSSAYFTSENQSLENAQNEKYDRICRKLNLSSEHSVLEIGCGWGGFAVYAASRFGCKITCLTLSERQMEYAKTRVERLGLSHLITFELKDYRDMRGTYDRIVSIEMIEAVGHEYLKQYFKQCDRLLAKNGVMAIQAILCADSRYNTYRRGVDWIRKHVFPGGHLPSMKAITDSLPKGSALQQMHFETFGHHYAETLKRWRHSFDENWDKIRPLGFDGYFYRTWLMYLAYCEAAFESRHINVAQLVLSRPDHQDYSFEHYESKNESAMGESKIAI